MYPSLYKTEPFHQIEVFVNPVLDAILSGVMLYVELSESLINYAIVIAVQQEEKKKKKI
jgi:hypothetical protein